MNTEFFSHLKIYCTPEVIQYNKPLFRRQQESTHSSVRVIKMWREYLLCFFWFCGACSLCKFGFYQTEEKNTQMTQVSQFLKCMFHPFYFDMSSSCIVEIWQSVSKHAWPALTKPSTQVHSRGCSSPWLINVVTIWKVHYTICIFSAGKSQPVWSICLTSDKHEIHC